MSCFQFCTFQLFHFLQHRNLFNSECLYISFYWSQSPAMHGTETGLVSNTLAFIVFFHLLSLCDLIMFWIMFREAMVKYIVLHIKCSTLDPKSTCLLNLIFTEPFTGTLTYEQIWSCWCSRKLCLLVCSL